MNLDAWLDYIANQHQQTIDMGLSRTEEMVRRLQLQQPAPKVVTVAGTNGKGSTITALESLLVGAGLRVLSTLSPHVVRFNERLRLNGCRIIRCRDLCSFRCDRAGAPAGACYRLNLL